MTRRLQFSGPRRFGAVAIAACGLVAAASITAAPAHSAASDCPPVDDASSLTSGTALTGLTVTHGTDPETFTGTYEGVLEDGIAPGVDMILADLHSTTIGKAGIWEGMSGSPVYAPDGHLIGAVSYSLGTGPSTIAGITPATEMQKLLTPGSTPAPALARTVAIPHALATKMVKSGAASATEVGQGLKQIRMPYSVSGLTSKRLDKMSRVLDFGGSGHIVAGSGGPTLSEPIPITTGGNMAASMSYGTITSAGLGTATIVCDGQVVGFGHPMNFTGPSSMSLHGARAVLIQDDPTVSGFKVANIGAPIGVVDNDRLVGIHGVLGPLPASSRVTSVAHEDSTSASGTTHITDADLLADLGFTNMVAIQDRVLDRIGGGTALARWTIKGERANGKPFQVTSRDLYSDSSDISSAPAIALSDDLSTIQYYDGEHLKITSVDTNTTLHDYYQPYTISKVQTHTFGHWATARRGKPSPVRPGRNIRLKVFLTSSEAAPRTLMMHAHVPARAGGRLGTLKLVGGNNDSEFSDDFFDEEFGAFDVAPAPTARSVPGMLAGISSAQQHNQVRATTRFRHAPGSASAPHVRTRTTDRVVDGQLTVPIRGLG